MSIFDNKLEQLGQILKQARVEKGYSTRKLAELSEIASNAEISMLENAKRLKPDPIMLKEISKILDLDYIELFQLIGYIDEIIPEDLKKTSNPLGQEIKVYNSVAVDNDKFIFGECIKTIYLPYCGKNCIGFIVKGNSMEPRIPDKSIVVVNTDIKELDHRNVALFLVNDKPQIMRVVKQNGNEYFISDNRDYDPVFMDKHNKVSTVGKVIKLVVEDFE